INQPSAILVTATVTSPTCSDGTGRIIGSATGGIGPFTYLIDGKSFQVSGTFTNLVAGNYTLTAKDSKGITAQKSIPIVAPPAVTLLLTGADLSCAGATDGAVLATFAGGTAPYELSLDNAIFVARTGPFSFDRLPAGTHVITVRDVNGCQQ